MYDVLVRHDWTYRQLLRLAGMAARRTSSAFGDYAEKWDVAMLGMIELLWESTDPPDRWSLVDAGSRAVFRYINQEMSYRGITDYHEPAPQHVMYWRLSPGEPATDRVVENIALAQVFAALSDHDAEVLWTRANFPDIHAAAAALGMAHGWFNTQHRAARTNAYRLWFDQELAPGVARDRRATNLDRLRGRVNDRHSLARRHRVNYDRAANPGAAT